MLGLIMRQVLTALIKYSTGIDAGRSALNSSGETSKEEICRSAIERNSGNRGRSSIAGSRKNERCMKGEGTRIGSGIKERHGSIGSERAKGERLKKRSSEQRKRRRRKLKGRSCSKRKTTRKSLSSRSSWRLRRRKRRSCTKKSTRCALQEAGLFTIISQRGEDRREGVRK